MILLHLFKKLNPNEKLLGKVGSENPAGRLPFAPDPAEILTFSAASSNVATPTWQHWKLKLNYQKSLSYLVIII